MSSQSLRSTFQCIHYIYLIIYFPQGSQRVDIYSLLRGGKKVKSNEMQFSQEYVAGESLENSPLLFSLSCGPANILSGCLMSSW